MRVGLVVLAFAISAFTDAGAQTVESFKLSNGVELPLLPDVKLMSNCVALGERLPDAPGRVCLEFPRALAMPVTGEDVQTRYTGILIRKGFEFLDGASVEYWFRWLEKNGCSRRLKVATMPITMPKNRHDWTKEDAYVLVMTFDPPECPDKR